MDNDSDADRRHHRMLQQWLLLILAFSITRSETDAAAIMGQARTLDASGGSGFGYFSITSQTICDAIRHDQSEAAKARLRQHASRIDNVRLREAFLGATGLQEQPTSGRLRATQGARRTADLWRGLR